MRRPCGRCGYRSGVNKVSRRLSPHYRYLCMDCIVLVAVHRVQSYPPSAGISAGDCDPTCLADSPDA